jgi:hypothetical protein
MLKSLVPDTEKVSERNKRKFGELIMSSTGILSAEGGHEPQASDYALTFQHPCTTVTLQQIKAAAKPR